MGAGVAGRAGRGNPIAAVPAATAPMKSLRFMDGVYTQPVSLEPVEALGQLDRHAQRIGQVGVEDPKVRRFALRDIQLKPGRLQLPAECLEVFDLETDVIDGPASTA